jgi:uncharacterized protein YbbC (DUF1343 family)/CubicO group peptidase (beta-lactamase class C family)
MLIGRSLPILPRAVLSAVLLSTPLLASLAGEALARPQFTTPAKRASASSTTRRNDAKSAAAPPAAVVADRLQRIDEVITADIAARKVRGAVVIVGQRDRVLYRKVFGDRAVEPSREAMTFDTIFDAASLTKVVATTTSAMILIEEGRLRLNDRVADYIPGFERYGKQSITIRHLMTHMSGLRPDVDWSYDWVGYDKAIELAIDEVPTSAPNERFVYSDINYFLLGHIISKIAGKPLNEFAATRIFEPLGMKDTMFLPPASLRLRIAPTERCPPPFLSMESRDVKAAALYDPCISPSASSGSSPDAGTGTGTTAKPGAVAERPMIRGVVHDPTSRRMGGVAGHAGLFTTADDLATFCRMLLNGGEVEVDGRDVRILSPLGVARLMAPSTPGSERNVRGLGWDMDSSFSANRGELLPLGSIGHTGFTGTSVWMDPQTGAYVVFMSSRLHPDGKGDVTPLRARVATIAAAALTDVPSLTELKGGAGRDFGPGPAAAPPAPWPPVVTQPASAATGGGTGLGTGGVGIGVGGTGTPGAAASGNVLTGIDVLRAENFARLKGKKIGLVTNQTGRARDGRSTIDLFFEAKNVLTLVALFSPEHGIRGTLDQEDVASTKDEKTGLTINSLYGATRKPTPQMLEGIDTLVVDIQDIGTRFWTYESTVANVMEAAAAQKIEVVLLDRPNPINGFAIEGPTLDADNLSFVGPFTMPTRHGLTMGELAMLLNSERKIHAKLTIVQMQHWNRDMWFDQTGLPWINPSPNMRNMLQATLYPGVGTIEYTNISVGRGTDTPFEHVGAPWIDGVALAANLNARHLPGIQFYPTSFTPASSKYEKELCQGVFMMVSDRTALRPVRVGMEIAAALKRLYPDQYKLELTDKLIGSRQTATRVLSGDDPAEVAAVWAADEARWRLLRSKYLLYR